MKDRWLLGSLVTLLAWGVGPGAEALVKDRTEQTTPESRTPEVRRIRIPGMDYEVQQVLRQADTRRFTAVKGRLIIKYKDSVTECVHCLLKVRRALKEATLDRSESLDRLHARYRVKGARPIFRTLLEEERISGPKTLAVLQQYQAAKRERIKQRFAKRTARTPKRTTPPDLSHVYLLEVPEETNLEEASAAFSADPHVDYAQPDYEVEVFLTPNDPYFSSSNSWGQGYDDLWGLKQIQAGEAWDTTQGQGILVAVVDTGVDYAHPDIAANVWTNAGELPGNNVDDDGNGYIDDIRGFDFANSSDANADGDFLDPGDTNDPDPMDDHGHGTHVAGTIAAVGNNNLGIVGVAPQAKILPVKGFKDSGSGTSAGLAAGLVYAAEQGADVINNSWGCNSPCPSDPVVEEAVRTAYSEPYGVVVVFAAGNSADNVADYSPQNMTDSKPIVVAASTPQDAPTYFTNYGATIDVAAPGGGPTTPPPSYEPARNILSLKSATVSSAMSGDGQLIVGDQYVRQAGTSMAAPHAAGVAALALASHPTWTNEQIREALRQSADDVGAVGVDDQTGMGRVNATRALQLQEVLVGTVADPKPSQLFRTPTVIPITGMISPTSSFDQYVLEWASVASPASWTTAGITLVNEGRMAPTTPTVLATWNLSVLDARLETHFLLRLLAVMTDGRRTELARLPIEADFQLQDGFPIQVKFPSSFVSPEVCRAPLDDLWATPQAVDLDGDGQLSFVDVKAAVIHFCDQTGQVIGVKLLTQLFLVEPQGPRLLLQDVEGTTPSLAEPVFVDFDGDGRLEVVAHNGRQLIAVRDDGAFPQPPRWAPQPISPTRAEIASNPTLDYAVLADPIVAVDVDADGRKEFIIPAYHPRTSQRELYVFDDDGAVKFRLPTVAKDGNLGGIVCFGCDRVATADLTGDGIPDVVTVLAETSPEQPKLFAFNGRDGAPISPAFPVALPPRTQSSAFGRNVFLGNVVGTPVPEMLVPAYKLLPDGSCCQDPNLTFLYSSSGQLIGELLTTSGYFSSELSVGDVNQDGRVDIISPGNGRDTPGSVMGYVQVTDYQGTPINAGWPATMPGLGLPSGQSVVADFDGDEDQEVVMASRHTFAIFNHDGTPWQGGFMRRGGIEELQVADVDHDGDTELLVITAETITAYDFPGRYDSRFVEWGIARYHDRDHTKAYARSPVLEPLPNQTIPEGQLLGLLVRATDADGNLHNPIVAGQLPLGVEFIPLGDINSDGVTDQQDVDLVAGVNLTPAQQELADLDGDRDVDIVDVQNEILLMNNFVRVSRFRWAPTYAQAGTYPVTVTVTDAGGLSATQTVTLTVQDAAPPPTVTLTATPTTITAGQASTLSWTSTDATSCASTVGGWTTGGRTSGTESVSPTATTTYGLTCTGAGGTSPEQRVTVTVNPPPPPTVTILTPAVGTTVNRTQPLTLTGTAVASPGARISTMWLEAWDYSTNPPTKTIQTTITVPVNTGQVSWTASTATALNSLAPASAILQLKIFATIDLDATKIGTTSIGIDSVGKVNACYVLSAAYGDPLAWQIQTLNALRLQLAGRYPSAHARYLRWYDTYGPRIAQMIQDQPLLKALVRAVATPAARVAGWWMEQWGQQ